MIEGIIYDLQNVTAEDLAKVFWMYGNMRDGVITGCTMSYTSSAVNFTAGIFSARGHLTKLTGTTSVSLPEVNSGTLYCNLVYQIDMSQTASALSFTQGTFEILTSSSAYPTPTQEDLDDDGTIYQMSFAKFILGTSGITSWQINTSLYTEWVEGISVPASGWSDTWPYTQSIALATTTADAHPIFDIDGWEDVSQSNASDYQDAFNCLSEVITTATGITLKCRVEKPSMTFKIKLKGI